MNSIVVISGPSGCGKSTLIRMLLKRRRELNFSVSHTTRKRRQKEVEGRDYYYIPEPEFSRMIDEGKFAEWARVYYHYYGTTWTEIQKKSTGEQILVLDIDTQGAKQVKAKYPHAMLALIAPPSMEELKKRLLHREKKIDENIENRLQQARNELGEYKLYDYIIVNNNLEKAYIALDNIITSFQYAAFRQERILEIIMGTQK